MSIHNLPQMPQVPQMPDYSALDNKPSQSGMGAFSQSNSMSPTSINFGTSGSSGTSMDELMDFPANDASSQQTGSNDMMQAFMQIMMQFMQLLQMMKGQQEGDEGKSNNDWLNGGKGSNAAQQPPSYEEAMGEDQLPAYSENDSENGALPGYQQPSAGGETPAGNAPGNASGNAPGNAPANTPTGNAPGNVPGEKPESTTTTPGKPENTTTPVNGTGESESSAPTGKLHLPPGKESLGPLFEKAGKASGIDPAILAGMGYQENRLAMGPSTVNGGNGGSDVGMMQVNESTFAELKQKYPDQLKADASLSNLEDNVMAGALYMKDQKEAFGGDMKLALRAYNSGPLNVNPNDHTDISKYGTGHKEYVDLVLSHAETIRSGNGQLPA